MIKVTYFKVVNTNVCDNCMRTFFAMEKESITSSETTWATVQPASRSIKNCKILIENGISKEKKDGLIHKCNYYIKLKIVLLLIYPNW